MRMMKYVVKNLNYLSLFYHFYVHFRPNCHIFPAILFVCAFIVSSIHANPMSSLLDYVDQEIYELIEKSLNDQLPDEEYRVQCIMDELRREDFANNFHTADIILNPEEVNAKLQPFVDHADFKCMLIASSKQVCEFIIAIIPFLVSAIVSCLIVFCVIKCVRSVLKVWKDPHIYDQLPKSELDLIYCVLINITFSNTTIKSLKSHYATS